MKNPNKPKSLYIDLPEQVHRTAKAVAALEGRQLGDVVTDAILAYVASRFPQLGELGSPKLAGNPRSHENFTERKSPKSFTSPPSPGSQADDEEDVAEELPPAGDDENPFAEEVLGKDG